MQLTGSNVLMLETDAEPGCFTPEPSTVVDEIVNISTRPSVASAGSPADVTRWISLRRIAPGLPRRRWHPPWWAPVIHCWRSTRNGATWRPCSRRRPPTPGRSGGQGCSLGPDHGRHPPGRPQGDQPVLQFPGRLPLPWRVRGGDPVRVLLGRVILRPQYRRRSSVV